MKANECTDHIKRAVRHIDHPHQAKTQGQSRRDDEQQQPRLNGIDCVFEKYAHVTYSLVLRSPLKLARLIGISNFLQRAQNFVAISPHFFNHFGDVDVLDHVAITGIDFEITAWAVNINI